MPTRVFNLTLHGIGEPTRPMEDGEEAVWLSSSHLGTVLDEAQDRADVRITVDDGNRSDAEIVLKELGRRELTATFFVVAERLEQDDFLGKEDLQTILRAGHSVGSHGMSHRPWRGLSAQALEEELSRSREILEAACGKPVTDLSCPFGSYDRRVLRRALDLGYERVYTSDGGPANPCSRVQPRTTILRSGELSVADITQPARRAVMKGRVKQVLKRWR